MRGRGVDMCEAHLFTCRGSIGKNWMLALESRLFLREEDGLIDAICMDGHVERFVLQNGEWKNRRQGDARYQLKKIPEGFVLIYIPEQKQYHYNSMGRLMFVQGKGQNKLTIYYEEHHISKVMTSAGSVLTFAYENDFLVEVKDALGRAVRYKYEKDCLKAVCHVDEGTTTYHYDERNYITQVIDQNGHAYVTNAYDEVGRVIAQYYLDGTKSVLTYDSKNRENTVYIEALNRTERYRYNEDYLVTHTYYDDGTYEEVGYDKWSNHIYEKVWKHTSYERDEYGRILEETDSLGNVTKYSYDNQNGYLFKEPSSIKNAMGHKTQYEYDLVGRVLSITNEYGTVEQRYNLQSYPTYVRDGNGNELRRTYDKLGNVTALFSPNEGADGKAWMYQYDFFDCLIETRDPLGNRWKKKRNLAGDILCETTPEGYETRYEYDIDSHKLRTIYPDGSIERCFYDGNGNLIKKVRPESYNPKMDDGQGITYEYDSMNRLVRITNEEGITSQSFCYDQSGNLIKETNQAGYSTFHTYDYVGNRTATWEP